MLVSRFPSFYFFSNCTATKLLPSVCAMKLELAAIFRPALTGCRCRLYNRPSMATIFFSENKSGLSRNVLHRSTPAFSNQLSCPLSASRTEQRILRSEVKHYSISGSTCIYSRPCSSLRRLGGESRTQLQYLLA